MCIYIYICMYICIDIYIYLGPKPIRLQLPIRPREYPGVPHPSSGVSMRTKSTVGGATPEGPGVP